MTNCLKIKRPATNCRGKF